MESTDNTDDERFASESPLTARMRLSITGGQSFQAVLVPPVRRAGESRTGWKHCPPLAKRVAQPAFASLQCTLVATAALALTAAVRGGVPAPAAPVATDKSGYTLFNPTPPETMRELSTDRPDQTESPYTVDAGHWQFEFDFANYTLDREDGVRTGIWNIAPVNVKLGLTNDIDLQMMFDSFSVERVRIGRTTTTRDWGDLTLRLKVNLWGNDGGDTAFGLMPFVKIPFNIGDAGNDLVEGGLIVPLAVSLPGGWGMGLMTEVDFVADETGGGRHAEWINSITFSHALTSKLSGYLEFFSLHSAESGADWLAQFDAGLTYAVNDNTQLDAGCNFGLTRAAPDVQAFVGLSLRF